MTLSVPQQKMTNAITKSAHSVGTWQVSYYFPVCFGDAILSETLCPERSGRKTAVRSSSTSPWLSHSPNLFLKSNSKHPDCSKQWEICFFSFSFFCFALKDTPPSISPQLPLKHNRCLPTRLPSTSCLVTASPLLSTTERLTNSMSELNLETPLIYPPRWIDRSWLHRGSVLAW